MTTKEKKLAQFEDYLTRHDLSRTAIVHYLGVVRRGLDAGDLLAPIRAASSPGGLKIARAAVLHWARFASDDRLERKMRAIANPPQPKRRPPRLTAAERARMLPHVEAIEDRARKGIMLLVIWSGLRLGSILDAEREDLQLWRSTRLRDRPDALRGADLLLEIRGWKTVSQTVTQNGYHAAYAILRRTLTRVYRAAGLPYFQPEEFRRLAVTAEG